MKRVLPLLAGALLLGAASPPTLSEIGGASPPKLEHAHAALIIIDAQQEYRNGKLPLENFDAALTNILALRRWAHARAIPVIHVQQVAPRGAAVFAEGAPNTAIVEELEPASGEQLVVKHLPNSFAGTELQELLEKQDRDILILAGFMTHMCVESTARAALDLGYRSYVVSDATATRSLRGPDESVLSADQVQRAALASIADRFGWLISTRELSGR